MITAGPVQFELFGGLPFVDYMPTEAVPEVRFTPAEPVPAKQKRKARARARTCPRCDEPLAAGAVPGRKCSVCGTDCCPGCADEMGGVLTCDECQERPDRANVATMTAFEAWLRHLEVPHVEVTEAKRAIFAGAAIASFDFLVYRQDGPNLLVLLTDSPTEADESLLREWEKVFGPEFVGAFVWHDGDDDWAGILLADWRGQAEHARPLRDLL